MSKELIQKAIDYFGSQEKAAVEFGIKQPSLHHALTQGVVSAEVALRIQKATHGEIRAIDLRPSLKRHFTTISVA